MKLKKKGIFGLLLGLLLSVSVVYAATALSREEFVEKMEDLGYELTDIFSYVTAIDEDGEESYTYQKFDSEKEAQEALTKAYAEAEAMKEMYESFKETGEADGVSFKIKCSKCEADASGDTGYVELYGKNSKEKEEIYMLVYRVNDTVIAANGENKADIVKTMKALGYYDDGSIVVYIIVAVVIIGAVSAGLYFYIKKKGNKNGNNMPYGQTMNNFGQPQPMNQTPNQFINPPMDQGTNFGQPQPMNQTPNQFINPPMDQGMSFGQPQPMDQVPNQFVNPPMDQGMSFGQSQPMNQDINNNPMNNNFPNIN